MKRIQVILLLMITTTMVTAQNNRFIYEVIMKPGMDPKAGTKKELAYLDVSPKKSVYYGENRFKRDSLMQRMRETRNFQRPQSESARSYIDYIIEKDHGEQQVVYKSRIGRDQYQYTEDRPMNWKILPETMKIGEYKTQKAETEFAGRTWTAWFTSDLPFQEGPYKFSGLPGLIVKIDDAEGDYSFYLKEIKNIEELAVFDSRGSTVKLKRAEYEKQMEKFRKDPASFIRSQFPAVRTGGPGGGRGGSQMDPQRMKEIQNRLKDEITASNNPIEK